MIQVTVKQTETDLGLIGVVSYSKTLDKMNAGYLCMSCPNFNHMSLILHAGLFKVR